MILRNRYTHRESTSIALRGVLTSVLQESQRLTTYAFVLLLLATIALHMLTFRLMINMVAGFCSLVILIHNTLMGEITISSTWTTRVNGKVIPHCVMMHFNMQILSSLIIWLLSYAFLSRRRRRRRRRRKWQKAHIDILHMSYITDQWILVIFHTFFTLILLKLKSNFKLMNKSGWKWCSWTPVK